MARVCCVQAMRGALTRALTDASYPVDDVVTSDIVLGFHELTGAKPVASSVELGFIFNAYSTPS